MAAVVPAALAVARVAALAVVPEAAVAVVAAAAATATDRIRHRFAFQAGMVIPAFRRYCVFTSFG